MSENLTGDFLTNTVLLHDDVVIEVVVCFAGLSGAMHACYSVSSLTYSCWPRGRPNSHWLTFRTGRQTTRCPKRSTSLFQYYFIYYLLTYTAHTSLQLITLMQTYVWPWIGDEAFLFIIRPENGCSSATYVVVGAVAIIFDFQSPKALSFLDQLSWNFSTHIHDNVLHQATVADFLFRP